MPQFLKTKWFWLNIIAVAALIVTYFINNHMYSQYLEWEGLAIVVLNAVAGMIQSGQNTQLKKKLTEATSKKG